MNSPTEKHLKVVYQILRYLKMTQGKWLFFKNSNKKIEVFINTDCASSIVDRKSTLGYYTFMWENLVTWHSKKQSIVARSSVKAEFKAMTHEICEGIWLKRLFNELLISIEGLVNLLCDNRVTISITKNLVHHD